jgi:GNAT superfamily N-acetyltransferase
MGDPIAAQYSDFESFADMLTSYYTDAEPEGAWVAEADGKVVGYMLSCLDSKKAWNPGNIALRHMLLRGLWFRLGTAVFYVRGVYDLLCDLFKPKRPHFDERRFPSHTHNNLLPAGRGGGVSKEFFYRVFDRVKQAGSRGLYGEVWSENKTMLKFIAGMGYKLVGEPYLSPGLRYPNGDRVRMQLVTRDLDEWVPGSWREAKKG